MTTTYMLNQEFNGIEIYFDSKPAQAIIDTLKNARWRWHRAKKCWYNKQSDSTLAMAQNLADGKETPKTDENSEAAIGLKTGGKTGSGYLGGGEWTGVNYGKFHSYGDINKAVKKEMQRLFPGVKFKTRGQSYSGGQSSHFYIFLCTDELFKPMGERVQAFREIARHTHWLRMADGTEIFARDATPEQMDEHAAVAAGRVEEHYTIDEHRIPDREDENIYSAYATRIMNKAQSLYASFIHDNTNSMVDYFDRNLYDSYSFVNVDNAHKRESWEV